jgi:hypothetical protein
LLLLIQIHERLGLVDLRLRRRELHLDGVLVHLELLQAELVLRFELLARVLRFVVLRSRDHSQVEQLLVDLRLQSVGRVVGVHLRGDHLLIHQGALEGGLQALVIGLRLLLGQLRTQKLLLELGISQIHQDGILRDLGARQHANAHHRGVGQRRNKLNAVFARHQCSGRTANLADDVAAFDNVGPDR